MLGLVLEGGGMRGLFTSGIIDVFMENGLRFDGIIGVSAGATFGCNYKSGQIGRAIRYNVKLKDDPQFIGVRCLIKTGDLISADYAYHVVPTEIDVFDNDAYRANPTRFHVVCTDIITGKPVYKLLESVDYEGLEWIRASASMPLVSRPVELDGMKLLDGGISDSIPLKAFQEMGYDRNIVILTQPSDYRKHPSRIIPFLLRVFMRKYPSVARLMEKRHIYYNKQLDYIHEQQRLGNTLVIHPDEPLGIGRVDQNESNMRRVYELGRKKGMQILPEVMKFVKN